jgi:hypothetical protein
MEHDLFGLAQRDGEVVVTGLVVEEVVADEIAPVADTDDEVVDAMVGEGLDRKSVV